MNTATHPRYEITKNFGDFNVFRYGPTNWPNYIGKARTRRGAEEIVRKAQLPRRQEWLPCGDGMGMVA